MKTPLEAFNEKEARQRFKHLDERRRELKTELDACVDEMIQIWFDYSNYLDSVSSEQRTEGKTLG
jgi:hypothetical protein